MMFDISIICVLLATFSAAQFQKDPAVLHCDDIKAILQIGSSSVEPISSGHSEMYPNPMVHPQTLRTGTTLGFENFLAGGSDISTASRPLSPKDYVNADCDPTGVNENNQAIKECQGRLPVGVPVAIDQLAVIVSNDAKWFPDSITFDQLKKLFEPDMKKATFLSELFGQQNGGAPSDIPMLYVPDAKSGTRDFFEEQTGLNFSQVQGYVDDNDIVSGLLRDPLGIGVVPLAFAVQNQDRVRILQLDGVDPLDPSQVSVYKLARPLLKYYDNAPGVSNFAVVDYICALLGDDGQKMVEGKGFVRLPDQNLTDAKDKLLCQDRFGSEKLITLQGVMADAAKCRDVIRFVLIGSSTVYPISVEVSRLYQNTFVVVDARSTGSSIGLWDLIAGAVPLAGASRAIRPSDYDQFGCSPDDIVQQGSGEFAAVDSCQGVLPRGVVIGYDMLAVVVAPDSPVQNLSPDDLTAIFVDGKNWQDVGIDLDGAPTLYVPDATSGTHQFFESKVGEMNLQGFVSDLEISTKVASDPNSIGFFGVAYARTTPSVRTVTIDGIDPMDNNDQYFLARPLYYYYDVSDGAFAAKQVRDLLCWVNSDAGQAIVESVGYVPLKGNFDQILTQNLQDLGCQ